MDITSLLRHGLLDELVDGRFGPRVDDRVHGCPVLIQDQGGDHFHPSASASWASSSMLILAATRRSPYSSAIFYSLGFMREDKPDGKRRMQQAWRHMLDGLRAVLQRDAKVRPDAFTQQFTVEKCADLLFSLMLSALLRQDYDPTAVLEMVRRTLY